MDRRHSTDKRVTSTALQVTKLNQCAEFLNLPLQNVTCTKQENGTRHIHFKFEWILHGKTHTSDSKVRESICESVLLY